MFRWLGEPLAVDLANTVMVVRQGDSVDLLQSEEELRRWLAFERARLGRCDFALSHLSEIRDTREDVRSLLGASAAGIDLPRRALSRLNGLSGEDPVSPRLRIPADGAPQLVEEPSEPRDVGGLLGAVARSTLRLVAASPEAPIRVCGAPSCGMYFLGQRRWCCAACGNRARAARHYRKASRSRA